MTKFSIMVLKHSRYEYVMKTCKVWHIFLILSKLFKGENKKIIGVFLSNISVMKCRILQGDQFLILISLMLLHKSQEKTSSGWSCKLTEVQCVCEYVCLYVCARVHRKFCMLNIRVWRLVTLYYSQVWWNEMYEHITDY